MTLTKASAARSATFFQIDIDPGLTPTARKTVPKIFQNRLVLTFTVDIQDERKLEDLRAWMLQKWKEIPSVGHTAFLNTICSFLRRQTVILGETGYHISSKVFI